MIVELAEMKNVMKIDTNDDDTLIETYLKGAISLVKSVLRVDDFTSFNNQQKALIKTAVYYATTFNYDFREKTDNKQLEFNVRSILNTLREVKF